MNSELSIVHIDRDFPVTQLENEFWRMAREVSVKTYWSGEVAPIGRQFTARLLWSDTALYVRFEANQTEPLVVSEKAEITKKVRGLWDRDVCEIFIAPDRSRPRKYFEFEIAPNGEWIDLGIDLTSGERVTNWEYRSAMASAAKIETERIVMAMKIPWDAFGRKPKPSDVWLGNIFRCVGASETRGYLAWQPTMTERPNFHVPERFGEFVFVR